MIQISNLHFEYPQTEGPPFRLSIPQIDIAQGEQLVLHGPSGCGKSTLLRLIAGELAPQSGQILHGDFDIGSASDDARRAYRIQNIGVVFQDFPLIPYLNALENTMLAYRIHPALTLTDHVQDKAQDLLRQLGLADKGPRLPQALSQGERQRVAIARALLTDPTLILADEPTAGLDPARSLQVVSLLQELVERQKRTLVLVTHDPSVRQQFERHVLVGGD